MLASEKDGGGRNGKRSENAKVEVIINDDDALRLLTFQRPSVCRVATMNVLGQFKCSQRSPVTRGIKSRQYESTTASYLQVVGVARIMVK